MGSSDAVSRQQLLSSLLKHSGEMFVAGEWCQSDSGETMATIDPSTEAELARVPKATPSDVDRAVDAAARSQEGWARTPWTERAAVLRELADRVEAESTELSQLDALDGGIPVTGMRRDAANAVSYFRYYAGLASELKGTTVEVPNGGIDFTLREPYGVVGRIVPFNHPLQFAAQAIAAPLVAGNAVVLKPADQTPLSALRLAELAEDLFPRGLLSVITGDGAGAGSALVRHKGVPRIGFTGSIATGRIILRDAAEHIKVVSLELGGKNPLVVFPDVDPQAAAAACVKSMNFTRAQGQSCGSPSRVLVHAAIHDAFVACLISEVDKIRVGDPLAAETGMGPLAFEAHYKRVRQYIGAGQSEGASLAYGGNQPSGMDTGYFLEPTVFLNVDSTMQIAQEEIFGPVIAVIPWREFDDVAPIVNALPYGLTANIWTNDLTRGLTLSRDIKAGYVTINGEGQRPLGAPFGGYRLSGIGRENDLSELLGYTQVKNVHVNLLKSPPELGTE